MNKWTVVTLDARVDEEISALPVDIQARYSRIVSLIETHGIEQLREPYAKHIAGKLWELRMKGKDGIARAFYVTATGCNVVVVRAFVKKTQKTPRREIELAKARIKEAEL